MTVKGLFQKYKSFISYAFFGVCTTIVNLASYRIFYGGLNVPNVASTVIAWLLAVFFAFVTNKLFVFDSKSLAAKTVAAELVKFLACRIATGVLDVAIMYVAVDRMKWNSLVWKLISNIVVIILNYIASKLVIFINHSSEQEKTQ